MRCIFHRDHRTKALPLACDGLIAFFTFGAAGRSSTRISVRSTKTCGARAEIAVPRLRALALFGRRLVERVASLVIVGDEKPAQQLIWQREFCEAGRRDYSGIWLSVDE